MIYIGSLYAGTLTCKENEYFVKQCQIHDNGSTFGITMKTNVIIVCNVKNMCL